MRLLFLSWTRERLYDLFSPRRNHTQTHRPFRSRYRLTVECLEARLAPAILLVTNNADTGVSGDGSLRGEIAAAAASGDTINFAPALNGATISTTSTLVLSKSLTI